MTQTEKTDQTLHPALQQLIDQLVIKLTDDHCLYTNYKLVDHTTIDVTVTTEDGDELFVGPGHNPGARIVWLGYHDLGDPNEPEPLIRLNSIVVSAFAHPVANLIGGLC